MFVCRIHLPKFAKLKNQFERLTKIGTIACLASLLLPFAVSSFIFHLICSLCLHVLMSAMPRISESMKLQKAQQKRISWIGSIIMTMSMGESLRSALEKLTAQERDFFWNEKISTIFQNVAFSQHLNACSDGYLLQFERDLRSIDEAGIQQIDRLIFLRAQYQDEFDFRRRSGQILLQNRIQSLILVGIHFALCLFMGIQFGWRDNSIIFLISTIWMFAGVYILMKLGSRVKWKT